MEPGFVLKIHFARYDRRELDTNYRPPWIFGAVPGGNGSAYTSRLMLAKLHLDLYLPSTKKAKIVLTDSKFSFKIQ